MGVLTGAVLCTALDSSSATIIALDVFGYAPVFLAAGFGLRMFGRTARQEAIGQGLLGAGLVFFGLGHLEASVAPLRGSDAFLEWLESLGDAPVRGALAGCAATVVIQSSSATVGIAIVMAKAGLMAVPSGVAIMLGAEIGTVSNTLVAAVGRGREALRCAAFHLAFNLVTVVAGLALIGPLTAAASWLAPGEPGDGGQVARVIANAQVIFNVVGVLVFLPLVPVSARALRRWIPDAPPA